MTLKSHTKIEEKLTCGFENDMQLLFTSTLGSVKIGTWMESFWPKQKMDELKIYRGVMRNDTEG